MILEQYQIYDGKSYVSAGCVCDEQMEKAYSPKMKFFPGMEDFSVLSTSAFRDDHQ